MEILGQTRHQTGLWAGLRGPVELGGVLFVPCPAVLKPDLGRMQWHDKTLCLELIQHIHREALKSHMKGS